MKANTARALTPLAVFFLLSACQTTPVSNVGGVPSPTPRSAPSTSAILAPSPNIIVGRVLSADVARGFAIIDIAPSAPPSAFAPDREFLTRTGDLHVTAHLRATRQLRGHTLGALIITGTPNPGDEVISAASP